MFVRSTTATPVGYIGCLMSVTGKVVNVHAGPKAYHLNFGKDYRTDFTAVLFRKDLSRLVEEGMHPVTGYEGTVREGHRHPEGIRRPADHRRVGRPAHPYSPELMQEDAHLE